MNLPRGARRAAREQSFTAPIPFPRLGGFARDLWSFVVRENKKAPAGIAGAWWDPISGHFMRSKFFWRICQSARPWTFALWSAMSLASLAFLVGRSDL